MDAVITIESISTGVSFLCSCGQGRIVKIESAGRDYKFWCHCGAKYVVTVTGKVFLRKAHQNAH